LKEWRQGDLAPNTPKELFNLRHSSLRNIIERAFGVIKKRFPILVCMSSYDFKTQCQLVHCCFMLHNFIRRIQKDEDEFDVWIQEDVVGNVDIPMNDRDDIQLNNWRDNIAEAMWVQYTEEVARRNRN
jgi:hypothetical protein